MKSIIPKQDIWAIPDLSSKQNEKRAEASLCRYLSIIAVLVYIGFLIISCAALAAFADRALILQDELDALTLAVQGVVEDVFPWLIIEIGVVLGSAVIFLIAEQRQRARLRIVSIIAIFICLIALVATCFWIAIPYFQYLTGVLLFFIALVALFLFFVLRKIMKISKERCSLLFSYIGMLLAVDSIGIAIFLQYLPK